MLTRLKFLALMFIGGAIFTLPAAAAEVAKPVAMAIAAKLKAARPDFVYGPVENSPMPGLYQVQVEGGPLLLVSEDGNFIITGEVYGVTDAGFVDLRDLALKPVRASKLQQVAEKDMIVFPAEGKRKAYVYVFTDVDCGYCRKLHQEVPALNAMGIEVRYLAFPRAGIGSASYRKIAQAWCADDRQTALTRLKNGQPVNAPVCKDNPVAAQYRLGGEVGVNGTPAIVLVDGTMLPGYLPAPALAERLGL